MEDTMNVAIITALLTAVSTVIAYFYQRWDNHATINRSLLTEISRLLAVIDSHYRWWKPCSAKEKIQMPLLPFTTDIYDQSIENIGSLNRDYASLIVGFYGYVRFLNNLQKAREGYKKFPDKFSDHYTDAIEKLLQRYGTQCSIAFQHYNIQQPKLQSLHLLSTPKQ
jgi:hypothetical protein